MVSARTPTRVCANWRANNTAPDNGSVNQVYWTVTAMSKINITQTKYSCGTTSNGSDSLGFPIVALKMLSWQATLTVRESITRS